MSIDVHQYMYIDVFVVISIKVNHVYQTSHGMKYGYQAWGRNVIPVMKSRSRNHNSVRTCRANFRACASCHMFSVCKPKEAGDIDLKAQKEFQPRHKIVKRGDFILQSGKPFHSLYVICAGAAKKTRSADGGQAQIVGFHFPGDVIGLDGISANRHACDVKALETTELCEFSFEHLGDVIARVPLVRCVLFRCMTNQIALNDSMLSPFLGKKTARDRLVAFFIDIATHLDKRGFDPQSFPLNISQADIGNYLGLAKETVSRLISGFQEKGLISIEARRIRIHYLEGLRALSREA